MKKNINIYNNIPTNNKNEAELYDEIFKAAKNRLKNYGHELNKEEKRVLVELINNSKSLRKISIFDRNISKTDLKVLYYFISVLGIIGLFIIIIGIIYINYSVYLSL